MNDIYSQLTTPKQAITVSKCPPNSRYSAATNTCIPDDRPSPIRRESGLAPAQPVEMVMVPMDTSTTPQTMGDALGTVKSVGMGVLNVLTLIGALGGLAYIWVNRGNIFHTWSRPAYWKGRRAARRGR